MSVRIAMIAAVAENGVIGSDQTIPWRIPSDFAWFKRTTLGKPMIMGRKQYETVGKPLPGRTNIVVTRQQGYQPDGVEVVANLDEALDLARQIVKRDDVDEIMIIGGGEIYRQMMERADRLYISHIALEPAGNVVFPEIDPAVWVVVDEPEVMPNPKDEASYRVKVYERRLPAAH
ncbi:dihydrofolate reductase [Devosia sp. BSSL-BM10]|uniref:Dihydrofolate reductase n=2 Tax=Devosia TaxID=46913 RepID=A0A942E8J7_9HYPH|nr:dihydrofolate reductase [Devosia litorisediminis]MBS3847829.1 dihydrofolate reductase [Devosia litorisediminis]